MESKIGNRCLEALVSSLCGFELYSVLILSENNASNNKIVLTVKISMLSESGVFETNFPNSFNARPNSIKKAMLKPAEKTILSQTSKFFNAIILRITIPGTKSRYVKQIIVRPVGIFAYTKKYTITFRIRNETIKLFNFSIGLLCKICNLWEVYLVFNFNVES